MVRTVRYCVLPADLAGELHDPLRAFYRDDPSVQVIVERRTGERRRIADRRAERAALDAKAMERRRVRASNGRRIGERRASLIPTTPPDLPSLAEPYRDRITFVERLEPTTLAREDMDTARLIARIQAGEQSLFDQLYMRYFDRVYAYVRLTLQDAHEAEDVTQDVFVRVLEALPRYERRGAPFRSWLFRIVRNSAITRVRQRRRLAVEPVETVIERGAAAGVMPAADSLRWLSDQELLEMIEELPLSQRQVIVLRYMMEFRATEIAEVVDRSPDAVRQLHQRAMQYLRRRVENGDGEQTGPTSVQRESMVRLPRRGPVVRSRRTALR